MLTVKKLERLKTYKKLSKIQQKFLKKSNNIREINHCFTVINNIGYKKWSEQNGTYYLNKLIIKEIHNER